MLIALAGLPGTGKTTIARRLAAQLQAVHLRIDTIEQSLLAQGLVTRLGREGYLLAQAVAADNLALGHTVIADAVNAVEAARQGWRALAKRHAVTCLLVEIRCSDAAAHRARVEGRSADIPGHAPPDWSAVLRMRFEPLPDAALVVDTAGLTATQATQRIIEVVRRARQP